MRLWSFENRRFDAAFPSFFLYSFALLPGLILGIGTYLLMAHPAVSQDKWVSDFFLGLIAFVVALIWIVWPILSAGVDDHSEISRYTVYPISSFRLLMASMLAGLLEPIAFIVYAPLIGAIIGYSYQDLSFWHVVVGVPIFIVFIFMCASWSRVGLHIMLRLIRSNRGGRALSLAVLCLVVVGLILPPVDTTWMLEGGEGVGGIDNSVIINAAVAFGRVPSGYLSEGFRHLVEGRPLLALLELFGLLTMSGLGLVLANHFLCSFRDYSAGKTLGGAPFRVSRGSSKLCLLVQSEAIDLWRNPRARLLFGVPFVLAVIVRLLSGKDLVEFIIGSSVDTWLMGALSLYGAFLLLSAFAQNAFAYNGHGLRLLLVSPMPVRYVLISKNIVHGFAATALGLLLSLFYVLYFGSASWYGISISMCALASIVALGLASGNFLSIWFPAKYHVSLNRRDKPPLISALLGVVSLAVGALCLPLSMLFTRDGEAGIESLLFSAIFALLCLGVYSLGLPLAVSHLEKRKENILAAITRS